MSVVLSDEDVLLYFTEIATGTRSIDVYAKRGSVACLLTQPTPERKREGAEVYKRVYDLSIKEGIRTRQQLERDFINQYEFLSLAGGFNTALTPVPLPAAVWLFISGLGIFGWFSRKQK